MPIISYQTIGGEVPKDAPHLLGNAQAQLSTNCDVSDGTLRALKGGLALVTLSTNPTKGIYTEDGLLFYSWTYETAAFKSPIINDSFNRVYYLSPSIGTFNVTTTAGMDVDGGPPGSAFTVGVPKPTVAPVLKTVDRTTLPDYPTATFTATAWWDYAGTKYSEAAVSLTAVTALRAYTFTPPALPGSPPADIVPTLVVNFKITDVANSNTVLVDAIVRNGLTARSNSLPGSVEFSLSLNSSGVGRVELRWGATESRAYTYTYENTWNEESAPAPPATISPSYVQDVAVQVTAGVFTGYKPMGDLNIYRTYGSNTTYIETTVTGSFPNYVDASRTPSSVGIALTATDFYPPVLGLEGLALTPGGWFVAFKDNMLYKSEVYKPHAWPYSEPFATNIRGILVTQSGVVVTTADGVFLVPGSSPAQTGTIKLDAPQAGVAQRSMVVLDGAGAFASSDGLVLVTGSVASIEASQRLFTREKWRERYGDILSDYSMRLAYHDGRIVASSNTQAKGFMLRLDEGVGAFTRLAVRMDCTFQLPVNDALYYTVGAVVYQFAAGSALTFDWWGKDFVFTYDVSFGVAYIRTTGSIEVKIYADGVLHHTVTTTTGFFRIPSIRAHRWSVRFGGTGTVHEFKAAQTMQELKRAR